MRGVCIVGIINTALEHVSNALHYSHTVFSFRFSCSINAAFSTISARTFGSHARERTNFFWRKSEVREVPLPVQISFLFSFREFFPLLQSKSRILTAGGISGSAFLFRPVRRWPSHQGIASRSSDSPTWLLRHKKAINQRATILPKDDVPIISTKRLCCGGSGIFFAGRVRGLSIRSQKCRCHPPFNDRIQQKQNSVVSAAAFHRHDAVLHQSGRSAGR